jgi:hypothetical protein
LTAGIENRGSRRPQLKVKVKGKEWDSGVGRDDTYGKCGRKKGQAERSGISSSRKAAWLTGRRKAPCSS